MTKSNIVAKDFWAQVFARQAEDPRAAICEPEHDETIDRARRRVALRAAGWTDSQIRRMEKVEADRIARAPTTSPGINRDVEALYAILCDDIEAAMDRLHLVSHEKVARGVEPRVGPQAAKLNVVMTDESVITVGAFLFRFCGLVARAFTRTILLNPWLWERFDYVDSKATKLLYGTPELMKYWAQIFTSFALTGTHAYVPYKPSTMQEVMLMEQVARAMEIFAIAHEYGHHHHGHGKNIESNPRTEEFEADQFALKISDEVGRNPNTVENPYLLSGSGGVILLRSLQILRSIEEMLGAETIKSKTHPAIYERIERFDSVRVLLPKEFAWLKGFRTVSDRIMSVVHHTLADILHDMPSDVLSEMQQQLVAKNTP